MKTIEYQERFGEIRFPEGFAAQLVGKTLEEQMDCYRITESAILARTAYGEITKQTEGGARLYRLEEFERFRGLVVRDGTVVGVILQPWGPVEEVPCMPYERVCTYYASDDEGSGTKDRTDYAYLICV